MKPYPLDMPEASHMILAAEQDGNSGANRAFTECQYSSLKTIKNGPHKQFYLGDTFVKAAQHLFSRSSMDSATHVLADKQRELILPTWLYSRKTGRPID